MGTGINKKTTSTRKLAKLTNTVPLGQVERLVMF